MCHVHGRVTLASRRRRQPSIDPIVSPAAPLLAPTVAGGHAECDFCGCYSPKPGKGWVAYPEKDDASDEQAVLIYCPPCAFAVFGRRPVLAATYVCIWKPGDTHGPSGEVT